MDQLDLRRHTPEEFTGKSVTIGARNYTIGQQFSGNDGYSHFLINDLSGLCLHLVQFGKDYQSNPSGALAASREKARETACLRTKMLRADEEMTLPFISVIEGNGGSFELHETTWGAFGHGPDSPGREAIDLAVSQCAAGDQRSAVAVLTALLESHPNHSVAIGFLAGVLCDMNDQASAQQMFARSLEIEPNYAKFRGQQIIVALRSSATRRRWALELFEELKARHPLLSDYDCFGIQAYVLCGEPWQARNLLRQDTLPKQDAEQWLTQITHALDVKQQLLKLGEALERSQVAEADLLESMEAIFKAYPADPVIQANLGSALYRAGQYQRAVELLISASGGIVDEFGIYCAVNLAFAMTKISAWEPAMEIFSDIMDDISSKVAHGVKVSPSDVPGLGDWFAEKGVLKSKHYSNYQLLEAAMAACPNQGLITPQVRQLAELYRQAADLPKPAIVAGPGARAPAAAPAPANLQASATIAAASTVNATAAQAPLASRSMPAQL